MDENPPIENSFYQHFASLLRVKTDVKDLYHAKKQMKSLKLPSLTRKADDPNSIEVPPTYATPSRRRASEQHHKSPFSNTSPRHLSYLLTNTVEE